MAVLKDYCSRSPTLFNIPHYITKLGQTITPSETYKLERIDFYTSWYAGDPGTCYVAVYETSGGFPSSLITEEASFTITASKTLKSITFSTQPTLQEGTVYAIVWTAPSGIQGSKELGVYGESASGNYYLGGTKLTYGWPESQWYTSSTQDMNFYCYGSPPLPGKPINPTPENEGSGVTLHATTGTWESGGNTDYYNVYYGTLSGFLESVGDTESLHSVLTENNFQHYGEIYYWRVDAVNEYGVTTGDEWVFTTLIFRPPLPTGVTLDGDGEPIGTPTGENNMITLRRLVAVANNALFYEDI